jgi:lysyl-tRNA synthetase class 2
MSISNTQAETIIGAKIIDDNDQVLARVEHLRQLEALVGNSYPNKFERSRISGAEDTISSVLIFESIAAVVKEIKAHMATLKEKERPAPELKEELNARLKELGTIRIAGRLTTPLRGNFVHLTDGKAKLQIYCKKGTFSLVKNDGENSLDAENAWAAYSLLDHGDFVGVEGYLFLTNMGELSVHVEALQFLSKSLLPMPDKMHGIADAEISRRYRYADLIASSLRNKTDDEIEEEKRTGIVPLTTREVFERRAKLISGMRRFLDDAGYIEVETPMLTPKATGAAATPFVTHHNALDITLYARIAPELYLKRLTVGGFEKVYELNRNFRNEGLSHKHNPEFTMLEFYCAYMDVNGMMDFAEQMIKESVQKATGGSLQVKYTNVERVYIGKPQEETVIIDFEKFVRITMKQAIAPVIHPIAKEIIGENVENWIANKANAKILYEFSWWLENDFENETGTFDGMNGEWVDRMSEENALKVAQNKWIEFSNSFENDERENDKNILSLFEDFVEERLGRVKMDDAIIIQPTFIIDYPKSISPLSKASPENPQIAERFELFINGMECANGFSELNDPQEQYERFVDQMKERETGDEEAMVLDEDYIRALAYGMPPAAGIGIGIDRLVMLLTNKHSIRDVILFPHMRPEKREDEAVEAKS